MAAGDPATQQWRIALGESTSARRVEAELGSALSALAAVQKERDEYRAQSLHWLRKLRETAHDLAHAEFELDKAKTRLAHTDGTGPCAYRALAVDAMRERDYARAQLDDLIAALGGGQ